MEVDAEIENLLSKRFDIKYYEKTNRKESGYLNFSYYEIIIQSRATDGKIKTNKSIAYPEITTVTIKDYENLILDLSEKNCQLNIQIDSPLYLLKCIYVAFKIFFPCEDIFTFFTVKNESNMSIDTTKEEVKNMLISPQSPCNNFTYGIKFYAKFSYLTENEEIIWDIDTVYANKEIKKFSLKDFDHLKQKYLFPVLGAMCYNTYFSELSLSHVDLTGYEKILERVFKYNKKFKNLYFESCNLKLSLCTSIANGLEGQKSLICLDLSCNEGIGDKGLECFIPFLKKQSHFLEIFKMSKCNLNTISICKISDSFTYNVRGDDSHIQLKHLDLSQNLLKEGFKEIFYEFLSKCNYLEELNLASMNCSIEQIPSFLSKGPIHSLKYLNLSDNISPCSAQSCTHWSLFFKNVSSLIQINLSNFKSLDCSVTDALIVGLKENNSTSITGIDVVISNNLFNSSYLNRFFSFIIEAKCVTCLDLSNTGIDAEGANIFRHLPEFSSLKSLNISNNFSNVKPKDHQMVITTLTQALQIEKINLQELYISNCNFGSTLSTLISELDCLFSLQILDISGNNIGNVVARTLGRMLAIDKHLKEIIMDNNNINKEIYEEILDGLEKNFTLTTFHVPFVDLVKYNPKLVLPIIDKINKHHIKVNKIFQGISFEDIKAMAFSCIMNQTSENIDKCKATLQESCNRLKTVTVNDEAFQKTIKETLEKSFEMIQTVEKSKDLLSKLNAVYKNNSEKPNLSTDLRIRKEIEGVCSTVSTLLNSYMTEVIDALISEIQSTLPSMCPDNSKLKVELIDLCKKSMVVSNEYVKKLFERFIEQNLIKKVYETQLNVTNSLCDRVTDEIISRMNICDINTNRVFAKLKNIHETPTNSISSIKSDDETSQKPQIRNTPEKERKTFESVRTSRMSSLAANKARPISKAIKKGLMGLQIEETSENKDRAHPVAPERTKKFVVKEPVVSHNDDVISTMKERPKPNRNKKPTSVSPETPCLEISPSISEEIWKTFQSSDILDGEKPEATQKKRMFFNRSKGKKKPKIDLNQLGKETSDCEDDIFIDRKH